MDAEWTEGEDAPPIARTYESGQAHSRATIALHWATVLAIVVAVLAVWWRDWIENENLRVVLLVVHRQAGNFVLLALGLRLAVRLGAGLVDHSGDMHVLLRVAALLCHLALYALLLAIPLLGLAASNAHEVVVTLFGLVPLPILVSPDPDLADMLTDYHLWTAWILLFVVAVHAGAACWHHLVRKDGVLVAMLPMLKRR